MLGLVAIAPFIVLSTKMYQRWLPYLGGAVFNYLLAVILRLIVGEPLNEAAMPFVTPSEVNILAAAFLLNATLFFIGLVLAVLVQIALVYIWRRLLGRFSEYYIVIDSLMIARGIEQIDNKGRLQSLSRLARVINGLEWVARRIDGCAGAGLNVSSESARLAIEAKLTACANHVRVLAADVAVASCETRLHVARELRRVSLAFMLGFYQYLPDVSKDQGTDPRRGMLRSSISVSRWVVTTILPAGFVAGAPLVGIRLPEVALQWLAVFALVWILVRLLSFLEPHYLSTLMSAHEMFKGAQYLGGKDN